MSRLIVPLLTAPALLPAAPAAADVVRPFDVYTSKTKTQGQTHVYGSVRFKSNGGATVTGKINDVCPEDGLGAYAFFQAHDNAAARPDSPFDGSPRNRMVYDKRGCSAPEAKSFSYDLTTFTAGNAPVRSVWILAYECDNPFRRDDFLYCDKGDANRFKVTRG